MDPIWVKLQLNSTLQSLNYMRESNTHTHIQKNFYSKCNKISNESKVLCKYGVFPCITLFYNAGFQWASDHKWQVSTIKLDMNIFDWLQAILCCHYMAFCDFFPVIIAKMCFFITPLTHLWIRNCCGLFPSKSIQEPAIEWLHK